MHEGVRKLWMYIVPLGLLAAVATCDTDFNLKNPFADRPVNDSTSVTDEADSVVVDVSQDTVALTSDDEVDLGNKPELVSQPETYSNTNTEKQWRLVIGSVTEKEKAERLAAKWGFPNTEIIFVDYLSTYRVVYESFAELSEAQRAFSQIENEHPNAWVVFF